MGALETYFKQDWKMMQEGTKEAPGLPPADDSPEAIKRRAEVAASMGKLREDFKSLNPEEQKNCQATLDNAEAFNKAMNEMHENWEKAQAPGVAVPPGGIVAQGRNASDNATDPDKIIAIQQAQWNKKQP
jgi:hypothetical protein